MSLSTTLTVKPFMATQKPKVAERRVFTHKNTQEVLLCHTSFVYNIEVYKMQPRLYNLEDSKTMSSKTFLKDTTVYTHKKDILYKQHTTLVAAPQSWLLSNNYIETI
jgi:hypothetical protein